jgi:hypothetical protein
VAYRSRVLRRQRPALRRGHRRTSPPRSDVEPVFHFLRPPPSPTVSGRGSITSMPLTSFTPGQVHETGPEGARRRLRPEAAQGTRGGSGSRGRHHRPRRADGCPDDCTAAYLCKRPVGACGEDHARVARDAVSLRHRPIPEGILAPHDGGREGGPDVAGGRRPGYRSRGLGAAQPRSRSRANPGGAGRRAAAAAPSA